MARTFKKEDLRLYIVLETKFLRIPLKEFVRQVSEGGATAIQLRDKGSDGKTLYETGLIVKANLPLGEKPLFIINDRADVALALEAPAVHLGIKDAAPEDIRRIAPSLIIGYSCNTPEDCARASARADYAGIGPVYSTSTKKDHREVLGLDGLKRNLAALSVPAVAIGGVTDGNIREIMAAGADGAALSSWICSSSCPYDAAKSLLEAIHE